MTSTSDAFTRKVLLTGDVSRAFAEQGFIDKADVVIKSNILDAIDAAGRGEFSIIGVVMEAAAEKLPAALKALKENSRAKIVLLARMYEEPFARELVAAEMGLADDYLICPATWDEFCGNSQPKQIPVENKIASVIENKSIAVMDEATAKKIEQLEELATTDELTGLKNRRYLWEFAGQIIELAKKENGHVTLLIFDIDDFKHYNDVYSHLAGDDILKQAAILMKRCCREHDVVARIGGDEFAVVFWDGPRDKDDDKERERRSLAQPPTEALFIANRFRKELQDTELNSLGAEGKGVLSISGGLASFPRDGQTVEELFEMADEALLDAKRSGKDRIYIVGNSVE